MKQNTCTTKPVENSLVSRKSKTDNLNCNIHEGISTNSAVPLVNKDDCSRATKPLNKLENFSKLPQKRQEPLLVLIEGVSLTIFALEDRSSNHGLVRKYGRPFFVVNDERGIS